jgi:hypothetical protein
VTWIALGCLLLGLLVGGAGLRASGRFARRNWRPGAGVLALVLYVAAAILAVREAFAPALGLALIGAWLTMSVRRTRPTRRRAGADASASSLDVVQASSILGVAPDASEEEVQAAYLRLIRRTHPDQGGTSGLAAQLNAARDTMLKRRG